MKKAGHCWLMKDDDEQLVLLHLLLSANQRQDALELVLPERQMLRQEI